MSALDENIAELEQMAPALLRARWEDVFRRSVPHNHSTHLLRRQIAWRLQEREQGGLSRSAIRRLNQIAQGKGGDVRSNTLPPGTKLVRDWNGHTIEVLVLEDGFRFEDRQYRSLSQIARHVTGARWSGPRFFGITKAKEA